jgi:hypothetical protein
MEQGFIYISDYLHRFYRVKKEAEIHMNGYLQLNYVQVFTV